jgi:epoxyqueuosine reductase
MLDRDWLKTEIDAFVRNSESGRLPGGEAFFEEPLLGIAALDDPLFEDYRQVIGNFHLTPRRWLEQSFAHSPRPAGGSVIVWVLPLAAATRRSNRSETQWPSRDWALTRQHGETLNAALRRHVVELLRQRGHQALAPQLSPLWKEVADPRVGAASSWSERHAAYAAGLGTFSLNDGLITRRGIAHRLGSVITDQVLDPDRRPWPDHVHNCLFHRNGSCGVCIERCPVGAIGREGHDKVACLKYVYGTVVREMGPRYGVQATGCGLCQTRVPCESRIPG